MQSFWIIGGALGLFALAMFGVDPRWLGAFGIAWLGLSFNSIVHVRSQADAALSSVQVMLKKRFDLIPGLIDAAQRYMEHEADLLEDLTRLRSQAGSVAADASAAVAADGLAQGVLGRFALTVENYPELKADQSFRDLQKALAESEEQISAARRAGNAALKHYNDAIEMFPTNLIAAVLRYRTRDYFEIPAAEQERPDVMGRFRSHRDAA